MDYIQDLWRQLAQYPIALIIFQIIGICFASVIIQGLIKNIIIQLFPNKYKDKSVRKVYYPIIVLIQGSILSFFLLTSVPHILWKIIIGGLIAFSGTTVYSVFVEYLKKKYDIDINSRNTIR
jgi:hypothetical protein